MDIRLPGVLAPDTFRQQLLAALPRLRRYARSLVFDRAAADDLTQTALERALSHWHQLDQRRDLLVWLLSIAHNAHLDQQRREQRMVAAGPVDALHDALTHAVTPDPGLRLDLLTALARLSAEHREILLLAGVEQLHYAECAEVLQIPIGTVMSRLARARLALRLALEGTTHSDSGRPKLRRVV